MAYSRKALYLCVSAPPREALGHETQGITYH